MAFIDEIHIHIKAGDGGDGVVRWRQEKFKPKSGPGGGDGGRGGDVFLEGVSDLAYLATYQYEKNFKAQNGEAGADSGKEGAKGESLVMKVPIGSIVTNKQTGKKFSIENVGEQVKILKGGRGGFGNEHFKSSTNTTPYESTAGLPGEDADFHIELELIADVGFVGLPSAGKSSLLNALTNAKSKVAEYHFTTLDPHLGKFYEFILADIPGLIEGASSGKGLGHKFLRHIKRTKLLVHIISFEYAHSDDGIGKGENMMSLYASVRNELIKYDDSLAEKEEIILLSKSDLVDAKTIQQKLTEFKKLGKPVFTISLYDEDQIQAFAKELLKILRKK